MGLYGVDPTGECWCNCGAKTPPGAFFLPGHEERAAAEIIEYHFGDVPGFVAAFGRRPGDPDFAIRSPYMDHVIYLDQLDALYASNITLEYTNLDDRAGPLLHEHGAHVLAIHPPSRIVPFNLPRDDGTFAEISVPFIDLVSVTLPKPNGDPRQRCTVRVAGSIRFSTERREYVALGRG